MSRDNADPNFDDVLGRRLRWSLRRSVVNTAPSPELWARIKQQVYAAEAAPAPHTPAARPRGTVVAAARSPLRRVSGRLFRLGLATLRVLDEHTMSSELVWRPETDNDVRLRLALQCISSLPLCGQMLASY